MANDTQTVSRRNNPMFIDIFFHPSPVHCGPDCRSERTCPVSEWEPRPRAVRLPRMVPPPPSPPRILATHVPVLLPSPFCSRTRAFLIGRHTPPHRGGGQSVVASSPPYSQFSSLSMSKEAHETSIARIPPRLMAHTGL